MDSERHTGGQWPENRTHHRGACGRTCEALSVALSEDFVTDRVWLLGLDLHGASLGNASQAPASGAGAKSLTLIAAAAKTAQLNAPEARNEGNVEGGSE